MGVILINMPDGSSGYQETLASVRNLPQKTVTEKIHKQEQARNLRMANYLAWANFTFEAINLIQADPYITRQELQTSLQPLTEKVNRPKMAIFFVHEIMTERGLVNHAMERFRQKLDLKTTTDKIHTWPEPERLTIGAEIFKSITGKKPKGKVTLEETTLGITLVTGDDSDYDLIYGEKGESGGFYRRREGVKELNMEFPLIVVKGGKTAIYHEGNHLTNLAIISSLTNAEYFRSVANDHIFKQRWGGKAELQMPDQPFKNISQFEKFTATEMVSFIERQVKDEVLADFLASGSFDYLAELKKEDGLYNYHEQIISSLTKKKLLRKLKPEQVRDIIQSAWDIYLSNVTEAVESVKQITNLYDQMSLQKRKILFGFVLAQVPLGKWKEVIVPDFLEEIKYFQEHQGKLQQFAQDHQDKPFFNKDKADKN